MNLLNTGLIRLRLIAAEAAMRLARVLLAVARRFRRRRGLALALLFLGDLAVGLAQRLLTR